MTASRTITVLDYDLAWPRYFTEIASVLSAALGETALAIEHVGSTSVSGLAAKPILDIDIVIESRSTLPETIERLALLGYRHQGDLGISGREAFARDDNNGSGRSWPTHHLYVCAKDSIELRRHLAFRDYLRTHPDAVAEYGDLKHSLAQRFPHDIDAYINGKSEFIEGVYRLALRTE